MVTTVAKGRIERVMAKTCLWSLAAAVLVNLFPEGAFSSRLFVGGVTVVAVVLFVSWIFLMGNHLYRMIFDKSSPYTIGQVLAVLFIPVIGAIVVSLRKTAPSGV